MAPASLGSPAANGPRPSTRGERLAQEALNALGYPEE
jgi:hypothetical protein